MPGSISRRRFLGRTAPAVGVAALGDGGPNAALSVGLIGCGSRGPYVAYVAHDTPGVRIRALCDVHRGRLEEAQRQFGHLWGDVPLRRDYRRLLDDRSLDAVIVATNGHWHVLPTIDACAAGKDVYLEKPVGTSIGEGREAVRAARRHRRIVQVGTQQRSWRHYREAVDIVRSGALGEISHVRVWDVTNDWPGFGRPPAAPPPPGLDWDFWLGPSPKVPYTPNRYRHHYWYFDYGGGWQVAWGVHHFDVVHWAMGAGAPVSAVASGGRLAFADDDREWPDTISGSCSYPPGPVARRGFLLSYTLHGGSSVPVEGRGHGKAFHGTRGTLILNRQGWEIRSEARDGRPVVEERSSGEREREHDAVRRHVATFADAVRSRRRPAADIETGHRSTNPGHLMNIAWRTGRAVRWDPGAERVLGDPSGQDLVTKRYRAPWTLRRASESPEGPPEQDLRSGPRP